MNRKIMAIIMTVIITVSTFFLIPRESKPAIETPSDSGDITDNETEENTTPPVETIVYNNEFLIDQASEKLDGEVVQYQILFHEDDLFSYDMDISYHLTTTGSVFYLIYLTNGEDTTALHLSGEASGKIVDLTTFRKHRMIGKHADVNGNTSFSNTTYVEKNESWYLTIAVARTINETLTVQLRTLQQSMEIIPLLRNKNVTLSSAMDAEYKNGNFLERYRGISFLGIGFSLCYVDLMFPVSHGGIICFDMKNNKQGFAYIGSSWSEIELNGNTETPENATILISSTDAQLIKYWKVHAETLSYPRKISLLTMVVDVYPYSTIQQNNWDFNHTTKISEKILERNKIRLQKLIAFLIPLGITFLNLTLKIVKPLFNMFMERRPIRVERRLNMLDWIFNKIDNSNSQ
jgi:hypothetical protein